jgi:hypothetical protein
LAARAQDIEPRAYSAAPSGVNFLVAGFSASRGGVATDGALPLQDPKLHVKGPVVGYARSLDLWGKSAKFDVIVPYGRLSGTATFRGETLQRDQEGFGDPLMRMSVILYGAQAMTPAEFRSYKQDLIIGASLQASVPLGRYEPAKLINLGSNRWFFKPELGISKAIGPWTFEAQSAVTFYTQNDEFYGARRTVAPLFSEQVHAIYSTHSGVWGSVDATYFTGGRTTVNGVLNQDLQKNWRLGTTLALPVNRQNSIKLFASTGVSARTGNNFDLVGVAWQHRWGAGFQSPPHHEDESAR